jgi:hypothetical protein
MNRNSRRFSCCSKSIFTWLVKVLKASIGTALAIAIVILILQIAFGIGPQQLWQQVINLPQTIQQLFGN